MQHARPPCPSPTPGVYSNWCPSSRWCYPAISSSVIPFSSCPQSLPASGSSPMKLSTIFFLTFIQAFTHWKDLCWSWSSNTLTTWYEESTHWKRPWCWERLKAKEEGSRGWDGWMTSPLQWTWTWANSWRWWGTGRPDVLKFTGSQSQARLSNWTTTTT